jgi:hypothetical protein
MKKNLFFVIIIIIIFVILFYKNKNSYYTDNICSKPNTTYQDGYRCYTDENKKLFNLNIVNCKSCDNNKGTWSK